MSGDYSTGVNQKLIDNPDRACAYFGPEWTLQDFLDFKAHLQAGGFDIQVVSVEQRADDDESADEG
jgi:hypothetical protein